jgi:hypothetical protein
MLSNRRRFAALATAALAGGTLTAAVPFGFARAAHARAGGQAQDLTRLSIGIFRGDVNGGNITLSGWGSGMAEQSKDVAPAIGSEEIKITTHGMYQGGRLDFNRPVDLSQAFQSNQTYMRFQVRFSGADAVNTGAYNPFNLQTGRQAVSPFKQMRFLLTMADGTQYELVRPVEVPPSDDPDRWVQIAFPLAAITKQLKGKPAPSGDGAKLKQLAIFGDKYQQFYVGEISVIVDQTDITVFPLDDQVFFAQQPTTFAGNAEGGASTLRYTWDFDSSDGIQEDAVGRVVSYTFPKSGNEKGQKTYKITLTVSDVDGIKKPASTTLEADVTD